MIPRLVFVREDSLLYLLAPGIPTAWPATNNVDSRARGIWPVGVFQPDRLVKVSGLDGERIGSYGPWFLRFEVPGRINMGLHAGREGVADKAQRSGPRHATLGCIRTSTEAMEELARQIAITAGSLPQLWVSR